MMAVPRSPRLRMNACAGVTGTGWSHRNEQSATATRVDRDNNADDEGQVRLVEAWGQGTWMRA